MRPLRVVSPIGGTRSCKGGDPLLQVKGLRALNDVLLGMIGLLLGAAIVAIVMSLRRRREASFTEQLLEQTREEKSKELAATIEQLKRSEEHTSELQSHSFISYAVFCLKKKI